MRAFASTAHCRELPASLRDNNTMLVLLHIYTCVLTRITFALPSPIDLPFMLCKPAQNSLSHLGQNSSQLTQQAGLLLLEAALGGVRGNQEESTYFALDHHFEVSKLIVSYVIRMLCEAFSSALSSWPVPLSASSALTLRCRAVSDSAPKINLPM